MVKSAPLTNFDIHKPSELSQVVFCDVDNVRSKITPLHLDILNVLFYKSYQIYKDNETLDHFPGISIPITINISEFSEMIGVYQDKHYNKFLSVIHDLYDKSIQINALGKNSKYSMKKTTRLLFQYSVFTSSTWGSKKHITLDINRDLVEMFIQKKKMFTKLDLALFFSLKTKYSKLLYELLKDYSGIGQKKINFDVLRELLNVDDVSTNLGEWQFFNKNVLKPTVKELFEKTDLDISYTVEKGKTQSDRLKVVSVTFTIGIKPIPISSNDYYDKMVDKVASTTASQLELGVSELWYKKLIDSKIALKSQELLSSVKLDEWLMAIQQEYYRCDTMKTGLLTIVLEDKSNNKQYVITDKYHLYDLELSKDITITSNTTKQKLNDIIEHKNLVIHYNELPNNKNWGFSQFMVEQIGG